MGLDLCNFNERKGGKKVVQQYLTIVTKTVYQSATLKRKVIIATISIGGLGDLGEAETLPRHVQVRPR